MENPVFDWLIISVCSGLGCDEEEIQDAGGSCDCQIAWNSEA